MKFIILVFLILTKSLCLTDANLIYLSNAKFVGNCKKLKYVTKLQSDRSLHVVIYVSAGKIHL